MTTNQINFQNNAARQGLEAEANAIRSRDVAVSEAELPSRIFGNYTSGAKNIASALSSGVQTLGNIGEMLNPMNILADLSPMHFLTRAFGGKGGDAIKGITSLLSL